MDATWTSTLSQGDFQHNGLRDGGVDSRVPTSFEPSYVRPLGDLCFIVGCEIPPIFIRITFPEVRRLVIIWSMVVVEQFESRKTTSCAQNQRV